LQNEINLGILLVILFFSAITNGALLPSTSLTSKEIHLVRCLTDISQRFFAPRRNLVISSPSTYRDVQQELIAEIWRTSLWPVIVTVDGNIGKPDETDFIDDDASYIILIPDENIFFYDQFLGLVNYKVPRLWNSEVRFVVAGTHEISMSQQKKIFAFFTNFKIFNCIILSQENYVIDKEYRNPINVNDVDTGMKLGVYTWFPYQSSDRCTEVNDITLLDSWVISAQGHFTKNTDLFPRKISNNLNGCPMRAVVITDQWNFTTSYIHLNDSSGNVGWHIKNLEIVLVMVISNQMNMTYVLVPKPNDSEINKPLQTSVESGSVIFLGDLLNIGWLTPFNDIISFYYLTSIRWYVPCSDKYPRWSSIFRILSVELWLVLIISLVITAISTTLVGRYSCTSEWQVYKTLTSSLVNLWAVILGVSVSTMPRAPSLRSLFLAWVCFSVAFSTVFQAFLTSFLVESGYKTPIQSMDELFASDIKLAFPRFYSIILEVGDKTEAPNVLRKHVDCPSFEVCVKWAIYQKNVSIMLSDLSVEERYAFGTFVGVNSEPMLCKLEDGVFLHTGRTLLMNHWDPLVRRVTEIIGRVVEAGLYNFWISLNLNEYKILSHKISLVHPLDGYYSFNLYHMQPAFYLLLMGWCLSVLCFMVELLYSRVFRRRK